MAFEIKVLKTSEELEALRPFWTSLKSDPESDLDFCVFIVKSRPEILCPYVIAVYEDGQPVSLLAGRVEAGSLDVRFGYKTLARLKIRRMAIFYDGFLGRKDAAIQKLVVQQLLRGLREEGADTLMWDGVQQGSELESLLHREPSVFCRDRISRPVQRWRMSLPASLEELLEKRMNKKHRYWAKRTMRLLEKDFSEGVRFACYTKPEEMGKYYADVLSVAKKTYQWGLGVGFRESAEQKGRLMLESGKDWLRGYVLYVKHEPVAFWLTLVRDGTAYSAYTGYDPAFQKYEVGTSLFLRMVGNLCAEQVRELDFGRGTALYKERFGDSHVFETTQLVFASSPRGILLNQTRLLTEGPMELARALVRRLGLEQKIKKAWRSRAAAGNQAKPRNAGQKPEQGE